MRLVLISDTHGRHRELQLPEGDVLIHAGDFSSAGSWDELLEFSDWFQAQPHRHKILIAGNHDLLFEDFPEDARALFKGWAHYLQDSSLTLEGLKIHGSPWTPRFFDYAFMLPRGRAMAERWAKIPADTQLLITHGPAQGLGDRTFTGENAGCEALAEQLPRLPDLQLHVFGHIHEGYGYYPPSARRRYASVNVSNCRWGDPGLNEPIWLDVPVNL